MCIPDPFPPRAFDTRDNHVHLYICAVSAARVLGPCLFARVASGTRKQVIRPILAQYYQRVGIAIMLGTG